jgi:hypothetical protein
MAVSNQVEIRLSEELKRLEAIPAFFVLEY